MDLSASEPFFIAAIVSAFRFALSRVFTCSSSWRRVPDNLSISCSCAFFRLSAAVATEERIVYSFYMSQICQTAEHVVAEEGGSASEFLAPRSA